MTKWKHAVRRWADDESAVTTIEYALVAALIAVVCIVVVGALGGSVGEIYEHVCSEVATAMSSSATCTIG